MFKRRSDFRTRVAASAIIVVAIFACWRPELYSQVGVIEAAADSLVMRRIWTTIGGTLVQSHVGRGVGTVGDINGDGIADFAELRDSGNSIFGYWNVYLGDKPQPSTAPIQRIYATNELDYPILGDFHGDERLDVVLARTTCSPQYECLFGMMIFRTRNGVIDTTDATVVNTNVHCAYPAVRAIDIDHDGADELVVVCGGTYPEIRIYRGGATVNGNTPSVVIRDEDVLWQGVVNIAVGDFDGDGHPDLMAGGTFRQDVRKLKIYWGDGTLGGWRGDPRVIEFGYENPTFEYGITRIDSDGDRVSDIVMPGWSSGLYIFRSNRTGKSARTRSFDVDDADVVLAEPHPVTYNLGYALDSTGTFETLNAGKWVLKGSQNGPLPKRLFMEVPNHSHFRVASAAGDCDGDGWSDVIVGDRNYLRDRGIVAIFAGGPYVPSDSTTSVREFPLEGHASGLRIWPNPVRTELNIAWRGDLRTAPTRFKIFDAVGAEVAAGEISSTIGAAVWRGASDRPNGVYHLAVFDRFECMLAYIAFVKG